MAAPGAKGSSGGFKVGFWDGFFFGFLDGCVGDGQNGKSKCWPKTIRKKKGGFIHESHENPSDVRGCPNLG